MMKLVNLLPAILLVVAMLAPHSAAASAATVVETINGGGTANMTDVVAAGFKGVSSFGFHATLYSDGSAKGHIDCVDHVGDAPGYAGNVFGDFTSWSLNPDGSVSLQGTGKLIGFPGGPVGTVSFTLTIQSFGGAGVGHWTLDSPGFVSPFNGGPICQELLTSGQIKAH
jgi:hypothetical protein